MKIAIVAPSPVPFTVGGVENLLWGLCTWINQNTSHQVELIKLPSREYDFWSLIETYESFYRLNLDYFDMVITTKYPAWMVRHKNHICYLQHRLRGLYDTYHFTSLPIQTERGCPAIDKILMYMEKNQEVQNLDEFFTMLYDLRKNEKNIPSKYFSFPAPFIREIVHFLDDNALSLHRIKAFYCISETVKNRTEYFPENCFVKVVHHPSNLKNFSWGNYKHIFLVSRLDGPKRIDLLIEAMKYVKSDIPLYIAGTGPQENMLKKMAEDDCRIHFLGFINDNVVEDYYKNSLLIPYFPYDEDYGLITIEAMMHKKPVITTIDAGGPTEFVVNGKTGFVVPAQAKAIAEKIDYFVQNPQEAKRMGNQAYQKVSEITWEHVVYNLLGEVSQHNRGLRKKIVVTSTFPIYPPKGGGQARTYNICKNLARNFDVEIISVANASEDSNNSFISEGVCETRIAKTEEHIQKEWQLEKKIGISVTDVGMLTLLEYTPEYISVLQTAVEQTDILVLSHPYMWPVVKKFIKNKEFIYEAQDVEYEIKKAMFPDNKIAKEQLKLIFEAEKECCERSKFIMTCSEEDRIALAKLYDISTDKVVVVPNGVDTKQTKFVNINERKSLKRELRLDEEKLGLFMGSWHGPNLEACEEIFKIAKQCPETKFLLMGSQCLYFKEKQIPDNVGLLGVVDDETKNRVFSLVDFALNPMKSGSGTNLKMFDYMAAGIPIITTLFGTRGIDNKDAFMIAEVEQMANVIKDYQLDHVDDMILNARKYVEEVFDWEKIVFSLKGRLLVE